RDGHAENGRTDIVIAKQLPEGLALAPHLDRWRRKRNAETSEFQNAPGLTDARRGQLGHIRFQIAVQEVKYIVLGRIDARGERRPGNRGKRGERRPEAPVASLLLKAREAGALA